MTEYKQRTLGTHLSVDYAQATSLQRSRCSLLSELTLHCGPADPKQVATLLCYQPRIAYLSVKLKYVPQRLLDPLGFPLAEIPHWPMALESQIEQHEGIVERSRSETWVCPVTARA